MPRPKNNRIVHEPPMFSEFKPIGVKGQDLLQLVLSLDEYEALRLADYLKLSHEEASAEMEISRSTFTRLIEQARLKMADFLMHGKLLVIEGGNVHFRNNVIQCRSCGYMFKTKFNETIDSCPSCNSTKLMNLAGGFGHGRCCENHYQKRGGKNA